MKKKSYGVWCEKCGYRAQIKDIQVLMDVAHAHIRGQHNVRASWVKK